MFGWGGPAILTARNKYERIEKALDVGSWLVVGATLPILLGQVFNKALVPQLLLKPNQLPAQATPLHLPWQWVDDAQRNAWQAAPKAQQEALSTALQQQGLRDLADLTPAVTQRLRALKLGVLTLDMVLMATKGQGYFWGKNWLTEKLSGKKGFSGEFNYATNDTLQRNSKAYEQDHRRRLLTSVAIGYGSALALPTLIYTLLKSPVQSGKGVVGQLKRAMHAGFNHTDGIYMSKWILSWHTLFNWNIPALLSSRDKHERRETLVKTSTALFLYTLGDDLTTGLLAKHLNRLSLKKAGVSILSSTPGLLGLPRLRPLHELLATHGPQSLPYKLGVFNFWGGVVGACAAINTVLPLLNNYYTHQQVMKEQQQATLRQQPTPPPQPLGFSPLMGRLQGA